MDNVNRTTVPSMPLSEGKPERSIELWHAGADGDSFLYLIDLAVESRVRQILQLSPPALERERDGDALRD